MILHSVTTGAGKAVSFVHGFTQTQRSWEPLVKQFTASIEATLIDVPGHGDTPFSNRNLDEAGADIVETMRQGVLVGYSMGARMALHAALTHSPKIQGLCLISGTAGIEDAEERATRKKHDEQLATHIENIGVEKFIDEWLAQPLFDGLNNETSMKNDRLRNTPQGLANSLRYCGTGTQESLWNQLETITIPVLIVVGELDEKFVAIGKRMAQLLPHCEIHIMKSVGHTAHLEDPRQFTEIFENWLLDR